MVEPSGNGFITEVPGGGAEENPNQQLVAMQDTGDMDDEQYSQDEDEREENQYFQVDDAEPPTNYDDAYSTLPAKIKLQNIKVSCQSLPVNLTESNLANRKISRRV